MQIKTLRLQTSHLLPLYYFYKDLLELPVDKTSKHSITIIAGQSQLIFNEVNKTKNPFHHFAFNIPNNKFKEALQWMQSKVELLWLDDYKSYVADFVNWHAKSFYFKDPAGNILEMIARFDLNDEADISFSSRHIRNISEIGIVLPINTFDENINALMKRFPISYFNKQPPLPHFRAIGNDDGLFVIVPENRVWFSTKNEMSKIFPVKISFIEKQQLYELEM
jgi:hypothetical protein